MQFGATVLRPMCGDRGICISPHPARDQVSHAVMAPECTVQGGAWAWGPATNMLHLSGYRDMW